MDSPKTLLTAETADLWVDFGQKLFRLVRMELTPNTSYHPQTDGQTERVNQWLEVYLRNYVTSQQRTWIRWFHLGEFCYNTMHHMLIDRHEIERHFEEGDLLYLWLQPYKQSTLEDKGDEKLQPRFYGPYQVTRQVGEVAYELALPSRSKIHSVFHVSCLKKVLGQHVTAATDLPPLDDEGHLVLEPEAILESKERKLRSRTIEEFLVRWKNLPDEDTTWEGKHILEHPALRLLEGKQHLGGEDCHVPSQMN
eukprot:PITA_21881